MSSTSVTPKCDPWLAILVALGLLVFSSCSTQNKSDSPTTVEIVSSTPPFQTKEPERYQAVRVITNRRASGEATITRIWIAKDGLMRREEYAGSGSGKIVYLNLPAHNFVLLPEKRLYAELSSEPELMNDGVSTETSPERLLNTYAVESRYRQLGSETVDGRPARKYQVTVNTSANGIVSSSETMIWVDENLAIPIKSETSTADGEMTTIELTDISVQVNSRLFEIPQGFEKVPASLIRQHLP